MSEFEYYWKKAEFQDPEAHRAHVENYKKGIRDSICGYSEMGLRHQTGSLFQKKLTSKSLKNR